MYIFILIYICFADAVKIFRLEIFRLFFQFTFKIQAFSSKLLLSRFRHFLPSYFQDQAFSSKILPRSDIFFQDTSKIRHFLPSYFQDQIFSCKILQDQTFSCKILQDQTLSSKIPARIMHCLPRSWKLNLTDSCKKCMGVRLGMPLELFAEASVEKTSICGFNGGKLGY